MARVPGVPPRRLRGVPRRERRPRLPRARRILIITLTQDRGGRGGGGDALPIFFGPGGPGGGGGGGGPYYHRHVGMDGDFWLYLYMRDIMWFTYWNEHEHRRHMYMTGQYGGDVAVGVPAAGKGRPRAPGGGGPGGEGGPGGDGPGSGPGSGPPPRGDPSDWARFVADQDDEDAKNEDKNRELSFIESVFAFVFGRGDPNDALEMRRWRAVSALLRVNRGVVFAEQVAPFLDTHLLGPDGGGAASSTWTLGGFADAVARAISFGTSRRDDRDGSRDASRMHEGYMLEVLSKFGGHAEASDDGKLVYVFPALQVTAMHEEEVARRREAAAREARTPPTLPPPSRPRRTSARDRREGGEKMPPVIGLGVLNLALVVLFWGWAGWTFARRDARSEFARGRRWVAARGRLAAAAAREDAAKAARATRGGASRESRRRERRRRRASRRRRDHLRAPARAHRIPRALPVGVPQDVSRARARAFFSCRAREPPSVTGRTKTYERETRDAAPPPPTRCRRSSPPRGTSKIARTASERSFESTSDGDDGETRANRLLHHWAKPSNRMRTSHACYLWMKK